MNRCLFELASVCHIKSRVLAPTDVSPVGLAAAIQLGIAIQIFGIQDHMKHSTATHEVLETQYTLEGGKLKPSDTVAGLGVEYNDEAGEAHAYSVAYLPVNRLLDGGMHDW